MTISDYLTEDDHSIRFPTPVSLRPSALMALALRTPWAILPGQLAVVLGVLARHVAGDALAPEDVQAVTQAARPQPIGAGAVAVIPLYGTIVPRAGLLNHTSGVTSTSATAKALRAALNDPNYQAIVLDVDSPGGAVTGVDELAAEIFHARGDKPIVAVANHLAASAAYWLATAADELVVSPSGEVGSIGVFAAHEDWSAAMEQAGIKTTLISAGKYKTEGNPLEPLGEEARAAIQSRVDDYYDSFTRAIAKQRGVSVSDVRAGFGEGRVVGAREAVRLGMADRVATFDSVVADLARGRARPAGARADLELRQRRLRLANH